MDASSAHYAGWRPSRQTRSHALLHPVQDALFELLKKNFDSVYNGNRAPFPLFVHSPWFTWVSEGGEGRAGQRGESRQAGMEAEGRNPCRAEQFGVRGCVTNQLRGDCGLWDGKSSPACRCALPAQR